MVVKLKVLHSMNNNAQQTTISDFIYVVIRKYFCINTKWLKVGKFNMNIMLCKTLLRHVLTVYNVACSFCRTVIFYLSNNQSTVHVLFVEW